MTLASFATDAVTVLRPATVLDHGTLVTDWTNATEFVVSGCVVQPVSGGEDEQHRSADERRCTLYAPPGADIRADDRVRIDGIVYDVEGEPVRWNVAGSTLNHIQVTLQRWEG